MPITQWHELLEPYPRVMLAGGLEVLYRPHPSAPPVVACAEHAFGAATAVLWGGADAVYLFNYFQNGHPGWSREKYVKTLRTMTSLEALGGEPRRHAVTYCEITAPGEDYDPPLPATGLSLRFELPSGPAPKETAKVSAILGVAKQEGAVLRAPNVTVNGVACSLDSAETKGDTSLLTYRVPAMALPGRPNADIAVSGSEGQIVRVVQVELRIEP